MEVNKAPVGWGKGRVEFMRCPECQMAQAGTLTPPLMESGSAIAMPE